jgi:hypothetical protein
MPKTSGHAGRSSQGRRQHQNQRELNTVATVNGILKRETGSRPASEAELREWLFENEDTPVGRELISDELNLTAAGPETGWKLGINKQGVKESAKVFVSESQDFQYGRDYIISLTQERAAEQGITVTKAGAERLYNENQAAKADAILLASNIGGVTLTEAQQRRLEAARSGLALETTYNERRKEKGSLVNAVERNAPKLTGIELDRARKNFRDWVQTDDRYERTG